MSPPSDGYVAHADGSYTFSPRALSRLIYRVASPKEKVAAEDRAENLRRIRDQRRAEGLVPEPACVHGVTWHECATCTLRDAIAHLEKS